MMKIKMHIRVAKPEDIETLFEIRTSVKENYQSRAEIAQLGITPESVAQMLQTDCCAWLAEIDEQAVGFAIANQTEKTIFGIFVRPQFEGQGIGKQLMQVVEDWFLSHQVTEIWLLTGDDPKLRAYGFYLHLGWTRVGQELEGDFIGEMKFIKTLAKKEPK